jgi:hypothetical protein
MSAFNVTLNVTFKSGPRAGTSGQRPLGFSVGASQGVATVSEAHEYLDFLFIGGTFQVDRSTESYVVNSATVVGA